MKNKALLRKTIHPSLMAMVSTAALVTVPAHAIVCSPTASVGAGSAPSSAKTPTSRHAATRQATVGGGSITIGSASTVEISANCTTDSGAPLPPPGTFSWSIDGSPRTGSDTLTVGGPSAEVTVPLSLGTHTIKVLSYDPAYGGSIDGGVFNSSSMNVTVTGTPAGGPETLAPPSPSTTSQAELTAPLTMAQTARMQDTLRHVQSRLRALRSGTVSAFNTPGLPLPTGTEDKSSDKQRRVQELSLYVEGLDSLLSHDTDANSSEFKLTTRTLVFGGDYRLSEQWVAGAALGLGHTNVRFGNGSASRQKSRGVSGTAYLNWSVSPASYVTAALSYEDSRYDIVRDVGEGAILNASTRGSGLGLSLSAGHDFTQGAWSVSPYVRLDGISSRIGAFDESGGTEAVSMDSQRLRSTTLTAGSQVQYSIPTSWGVVLPFIRVELTRRTESQDTPSARLINGGTAMLIPTSAGNDSSYGNWALGMSSITQHGMTMFVEYESGFALQGYRSQRFSLGLRHEL